MPLDPDRPFLISPPFGAYLRHSRAYSVLGSYTAEPRTRATTGESRTARVLKTLRPIPGGWVNAIGLRNPGWGSLPYLKRIDSDGPFRENLIVSLAPIAPSDWDGLERWLADRPGVIAEINVSCPNVDAYLGLPSNVQLGRIARGNHTVIFKLPPARDAVNTVAMLADNGVSYFHLSNALPSPVGGISGAPLREVNLSIVSRAAEWLSRHHPMGEVIAGGGIYRPEHLTGYRSAGATRFSLAVAWFWPPRALQVIRSC